MTTPTERPSTVRYYVLAALLLITAINYVQRNCISPAMTTIEDDLGVTGVQLDLAAGAFFLAYTLLQVPSGWLAQRWGPRLTLPLYAVGWSAALVLCALAAGFPELYAGRLLMGALQAGIFPCATLILAVWYPASQRGLATALLNSFMLLGGAAGVVLAGRLLGPIGWRGVFLGYSIPGFLWAAWFLWWFRDRPEQHPRVNAAELELLGAKPVVVPTQDAMAKRSPPKESSRPTDAVLANRDATTDAEPQPTTPPSEKVGMGLTRSITLPGAFAVLSLPFLLLYTQQGFRAAANRLFDSRMPTYLERERGVSKENAAALASMPQWAGVVGGVVGGALSDWVLRRTGSRRLGRNGVAAGSLIVSMLIYLAAYFIADITLAMAVTAVAFFIFCFSSPCAYALTIDMGGPRLAIVFGMMNMIGNLGAFAFVSSITALVNLGGWNLALAVWFGLHVVALVCWLFLDPNRDLTAAPKVERA